MNYICLMHFLKRLFNFYINSSVHVALAVYSLVRVTELYFELSYNASLNYFIFFGTITGYNFVKYAGVAKFHHRSLTTQLKIIQIFSLICFLAMCFYAWQLPIKTLLYFVPFLLLTVLYAVPFLSGFQKNLRNISYLKIIVVAVVWAGFTTLIPVLDAGEPVSGLLVLSSLQRFVLVMVLILPFDIRDVKYDAISLQTIPQKIGVKRTKKIGLILLLLAMVIEFMIAPTSLLRNAFLGLFFVVLFFLMNAKIEQSKYYSSFWVEGIPIVWYLILLLMML